MALRFKDRFRIDPAAIDHDGEKTEGAAVISTDDGDGLSGFHALPYAYEVLCVVGIDGLEPVVVSDDDGVAVLLCALRQSNGTTEHGFHGITFRSCYL